MKKGKGLLSSIVNNFALMFLVHGFGIVEPGSGGRTSNKPLSIAGIDQDKNQGDETEHPMEQITGMQQQPA